MAGKADIVDNIATHVGISKKQAAEAFDTVFESITASLKNEERVQLPGFGSFSTGRTKARTGRNPSTGEPIDIPESVKVKFKMGKELKEAVNG